MSQTFESGLSNTYKLRLVVTEDSTSLSGNTSSMSYKLYMVATTAKYYQSGVNETYKVTLNGTTYTHTVKTYFSSGNTAIQIGSGTGISVAHNADGTKSLSVSASYTKASSTSYAPSGNMSLSGTMTLTTIPRASTLFVSSGNGTKPGNGSIELTISRASSSFTHTVTWSCGGLTGTVGSSLSTSASWAVPLSLIDKSPNADQTVTFTCTTYNGSTNIGSKTCTATVGHHSASSISTQSGQTLGSTMSFTISRSHGELTHSMWYSFGSKSWQVIGSSIATSNSFTPPLSLCSEIPHATSGSMTIILRTYYGSTQIGSDQYKYYTMNVPTSVVPTFTDISCVEANDEVKTLVGAYVQNKSRLTLDIIGATGVQGSTIQSYKIAVAGQTINAQTGTTSLLSVSGSQTIVATITDSRGRTATKEKTIDILPYINPKISDVDVYRNTNTTAQITASLSCSSLLVQSVEKNHPCYKIDYKPSSASSYISVTGEYEKLSATLSKTLTGLQEDKSYEIHIFVGDIFGYNSLYEIQRISTAFKSFDFDVKTGRLGIEKVLEHDDSVLEVPEGAKIYVGNTPLVLDQNYTWDHIQGKPTTYPPSPHTHDSLTDRTTGNACYLNYGATGLTTASWLAAWNGYELRAISPTNLRNVIGAAESSHTHNYLPLSGGTMSGQISRPGTSTNWVSGRNGALIKSTSYTGYNAIASMKTTNGSWEIGVYSNNTLYFTYISDSHYNSSTNTTTTQVYISSEGHIYMNTGTVIRARNLSGVMWDAFEGCDTGGNTNVGYGSYEHKSGWGQLFGNTVGLWANTKIQGNKAYTQSSDERLKTNFEDISDSLLAVWSEIQPCVFEWKNDEHHEKHIGIKAQDVIRAFEKYGLNWQESAMFNQYKLPDKNDDTEYFGLTYEYIDMLTMKVVKNQQKYIEKLQKEIDDLKEQVQILMKFMEEKSNEF